MRYVISDECFKRLSSNNDIEQSTPVQFIIDTSPDELDVIYNEAASQLFPPEPEDDTPESESLESGSPESEIPESDEIPEIDDESTFEEDLARLISDYDNPDIIMSKSVIPEGFEKLNKAPKYVESKASKNKTYRQEKQKTKGPKWFNMPATELTPERRRDLQIISMQSVLDPKRFYKNSKSGVSKFFQMGKVVESKADFYHSRIPKKQRKQTILEEVMADQEMTEHHKKKYGELVKTKVKKDPFLKKLQKVKRNQRSFRNKNKINKKIK